MDILFVTTTEKLKLNAVSNGTMLLGTKLLQAGFDVDILHYCQIQSYKKDYNTFISDITNKILKIDPKCVSFYTLWPYYHIVLRIAKELKLAKNEIIIILGGPQASATAEETLRNFECIDYICTGEGENTVVPFFTALLQAKQVDVQAIPGLFYRQEGIVKSNTSEIPLCNLNELPHWDDRLINAWNPLEELDIHSKNYFMPIDAGRGCPFSCTFCSTSRFWRRTYRLKSAEKIIDDIQFYKNKYGINSFYFSHDAFTTNKKLISAVCDQIIERKLNITWRCTTRVDCLSEELLQKMIQAGLTRIEVGIETGSPRMQKIINKRLDLEYAKKMISIMIKNKLYVELFFIYGFPEETIDDLNQTMEYLFYCLDIGVSRADMNLLRFSPATQLTIDYFDKLTLDNDNNKLSRGVFGYENENVIIERNKKIFTSFYNLKNTLRIEFEYLYYLEWLYEKRKISMSFLRKLYQGDNVTFYKDFIINNKQLFNDLDLISSAIKNDSFKIVNNMIQDKNWPCLRQIKSLLCFDNDLEFVSSHNSNISITKVYNFNYLDYLENIPPIQFSNYKSKLKIQKEDGNIGIQLIDIQPS